MHGQDKKTTEPVAQRDMAAACGLDRRETVTRRISKFAPQVEAWENMHGSGTKESDPRQPRVMFARMRQAPGNPNRYAYAGLPEDTTEYRIRDTQEGTESDSFIKESRAIKRCQERNKEKGSKDRFQVVSRMRVDPECYHAPTLTQLLEDGDTGEWWDPKATWCTGFKDVPAWIWDPRLKDPDDPEKSLGDIPRVLMSYYWLKGLADDGELALMRDVVARDCGICPSSVTTNNQKISRLGDGTIFRVVPRGGCKRDDGSYEPAKPTLILYLPLRTISHEDAEAERKRYATALAGFRRTPGTSWPTRYSKSS